ncbi:MAG: helix-turn-helix domain-containing protein [Caldilineaceae bacterium]
MADQTPSLGYWIRRRRKSLDFTQEQLAQQVGCAVATIKKIEADARRPSRPMAERIADCLQIPVQERAAFLKVARAELSLHRVENQLSWESTARVSPALNPQATQQPNNLPVSLNRLIGREKEIHQLQALLLRPDVRLVTMIGPGGIGKTRLALQVAHAMMDRTTAEIWFVNLASVQDPALVLSTIAQTLGANTPIQQSAFDRVAHYLQPRQAFLLLDNFEQVIDAAPQLSELLSVAPELKILVTSRAVLHLASEYEFDVLPLALPDMIDPANLPTLSQCESVQLLLDRAQAKGATLLLTPENAVDIAQVCLRLEGIPLALELAAARCKIFGPADLLRRLEHRLQFLTNGARDQPLRQQTLRATIEWSYQLLPLAERTLFARLSVFVGGFTLEAAEAICREFAGSSVDVAECLAFLLDQSLLRQSMEVAGERRFVMLETLREYAQEQALAHREDLLLYEQHAHYYSKLAEQAQPLLFSAQQQTWLQRLALEQGNFHAALQWRRTNHDCVQVAHLASNLCWFWIKHGDLHEEVHWADWALDEINQHAATVSTTERAKIVYAAALSADWTGKLARAHSLYEEYLRIEETPTSPFDYYDVLDSFAIILVCEGELQRALVLLERAVEWARLHSKNLLMADALAEMGSLLHLQGDYLRASQLLYESLALRQAEGIYTGIASAKGKLAVVVAESGDFTQAQLLLEEAIELASTLHDKQLIGGLLSKLGLIAQLQQHYDQAVVYQQRALVLFQEMGFQIYSALALVRLGNVALLQSELAQAQIHYQASLALSQQTGYQLCTLLNLEGLAGVAVQIGYTLDAAHWLGASQAYRQTIGLVHMIDERQIYEHILASACNILGAAQVESAIKAGRSISLDNAVAQARTICTPQR